MQQILVIFAFSKQSITKLVEFTKAFRQSGNNKKAIVKSGRLILSFSIEFKLSNLGRVFERNTFALEVNFRPGADHQLFVVGKLER